MTAVLAEIASINPRIESPAPGERVSFVGMAELNAESAVATPLETRLFGDVARGYTVFRDGDILVAKITPCFENGKIGVAALDHGIGVGSTEFHVVRPTPRVDRRYLLHYLRQPLIRIAGEMRMTGSGGQRRVPADFLKQLEMRIPPIEEQRRIAAILDQADALRAKRRQVVAHLDSVTQSIFHDMFGSPLQDPTHRLSDLSRVIRGASPRPAGDPRYFGGAIPWLKISDVSASSGPYVTRIKETVTEAGRDKSVLLPPQTLILTNSATVGIAKIIESATCIHDGFLAFLDVSSDVERNWLQAALQSIRPYLVSLAPEGTQKNLNGPIVKAIQIRIPDLARQRDFLARAQLVDRQRADHLAALAAGEELFVSLQSRAFRGEL